MNSSLVLPDDGMSTSTSTFTTTLNTVSLGMTLRRNTITHPIFNPILGLEPFIVPAPGSRSRARDRYKPTPTHSAPVLATILTLFGIGYTVRSDSFYAFISPFFIFFSFRSISVTRMSCGSVHADRSFVGVICRSTTRVSFRFHLCALCKICRYRQSDLGRGRPPRVWDEECPVRDGS
jgi:hypothetical protein